MNAEHPLKAGQRVELHPALDDWMRGDRYGVVVRTGTRGSIHWTTVRLDRSGRTRTYNAETLTVVS